MLAAGCAAKGPPQPPAPVTLSLNVHLAGDGNPDASGRASPTVVRLYQLRSDDVFKGLDLDVLYARDKELLAADLVQREEWTLRPGESREARWQVAPEVRVVAVVAALRGYREVVWRVTLPMPPASAKVAPPRSSTVEIAGDGVRLAEARPSK